MHYGFFFTNTACTKVLQQDQLTKKITNINHHKKSNNEGICRDSFISIPMTFGNQLLI